MIIYINTRPSSLVGRLPWFVLQSMENISVDAEKVRDKFFVKKDHLIEVIKKRGYGFVDAAKFLKSFKGKKSISFLETECEQATK